jgi:type IV fimbrial biogenesis protein FimT
MICVMNGTCNSIKKTAGFTLVEAMVVAAILSILTALAFPSFQDAMDRYRSSAVYDELRSTYTFARSEAVRTRSRVIAQRTPNANCPTVQEWQCGWNIYVDANGDGVQQVNPAAPAVAEPSLRTIAALTGGTVLNTFKGNQSQVVFDRWGNVTPLGAFRQVIVPRGIVSSTGVMTMCASSGGQLRSVAGDIVCP